MSRNVKPPLLQFNGHLQTILGNAFRKLVMPKWERERFTTSDDDFLDLYWLTKGSKNLVVITHGLEGNAERGYITGIVREIEDLDIDIMSWNCRSCSEEINLTAQLYGHGQIDDLHELLNYAISKNSYESIILVGVSMGANMSTKLATLRANEIDAALKGVVAISSPCDLEECSNRLDLWQNFYLKKRFLNKLKEKIKSKSIQFPDIFDPKNLDKVSVWKDFDDWYSAPINGYKDSAEFYKESSPNTFLPHIETPILIINALNDPIFGENCFPFAIAEKNPYVTLDAVRFGGHTGFAIKGQRGNYAEMRTRQFISKKLGISS